MFLSLVCLILGFITLLLSFSNNPKISKWQNNKFIKVQYKESYIKTTKKLLFLQGIFFISSSIANYNKFRTINMISLYIIIILGAYSTFLTFRKNH